MGLTVIFSGMNHGIYSLVICPIAKENGWKYGLFIDASLWITNEN